MCRPVLTSGLDCKRLHSIIIAYIGEVVLIKVLFVLIRLVIDGEDDREGYEARPDWAKAVSAGKSGGDQSQADIDILSDLQEEALYIPRSRVTDFTTIGEGMCVLSLMAVQMAATISLD